MSSQAVATDPFQGLLDSVTRCAIQAILYPLERIVSVLQIRHTYASPQVVQEKYLASRCWIYGVRARFRGFTPFAIHTAFLSTASTITPPNSDSLSANYLLPIGVRAILSTLLYPLEMAQIRMCGEIELQRKNSSLRICLGNLRRDEGLHVLGRGLPLALFNTALQLGLLRGLVDGVQAEEGMSEGQRVAALFGGALGVQLLMHPLQTLKKCVQISGAMGHNSTYASAKESLKIAKVGQLYGGILHRLAQVTLYFFLWHATLQRQRV